MTSRHVPGADADPRVRGPLTWALYSAILVGAVVQSALGGLLPFMQVDLSMSHTIASLHVTGLAVGGLAAAIVVEPARRRLGRWVVAVAAVVVGMVAGLVLALAPRPEVSVVAFVLVGLSVSTMLITGQTSIVARHGFTAPRFIGELNVAYSVGAVAAAGLLPLIAGSALGWRFFPVLQVLAFALLVLPSLVRGRSEEQPAPARSGARTEPEASAVRAPGVARPRLAYLAMCLCIAVEWSFLFWFASYLTSVAGMSAPAAAGVASVMWVAILVGRFVGSRLLVRHGAPRVLVGSLLLAVAAAGTLSLTRGIAVGVVAAVLAGIATANLYPASIALVVSAFPARPDAAVARASLLTSGVVVIFPLVLGRLADAAGLYQAFWVVPVTALLALGAIRISGPAPTVHHHVAASTIHTPAPEGERT